MKVLVAYASKADATKGIAEFIGERLRRRGVTVEVHDVGSTLGVEDYDAFIVGSAVYMFHWLKEAREFVSKNQSLLSKHPVWLYSSGPVGLTKTDSKGHDMRDVSVSGPKELEELAEAAKPLDHRVFFGALCSDKLGGAMGLTLKIMRRSKAVRESMPDGDYRDWEDIGAWADSIVDALAASKTSAMSAEMAQDKLI